ncbi:MAG: MFS transporter [Candidatus Hydrogenedentes bacterium]|nr:MFS transporter [Candidatus Hydrogenedentota bacterium]
MGIDTLLYFRLSAMMFLEFAVWGAWAPVLASYLINDLKLSGKQTGWVYATLWIACIISPFLGGQIADRYLATQIFLGLVHLLGGACLLYAAFQKKFLPLFVAMFVYSLLYAPTLALVNSLMFSHITNADVVAPRIRVWGTIGWIVAGWLLSVIRTQEKESGEGKKYSDCLLVAGILSLILGVYCFTLPNTPPPDKPGNPLAFLEAFSMMKETYFLVFLIISFVVTTELQFYYVPTAPFLQDIGVSSKYVPAVMTIAQIAEIVGMAVLLPWAMVNLGIQWVLAIGVIAWPLRYMIFALMKPLWLIIASLSFHGIGYTFFFFAGQMFVDKVAPPDIKASAQALIAVATLGLGNFIGTQFTGIILDIFKDEEGKFKWRPIFVIPCVLTILCAIAFVLFFHPPANPGQ